jgi:hypothetical protein
MDQAIVEIRGDATLTRLEKAAQILELKGIKHLTKAETDSLARFSMNLRLAGLRLQELWMKFKEVTAILLIIAALAGVPSGAYLLASSGANWSGALLLGGGALSGLTVTRYLRNRSKNAQIFAQKTQALSQIAQRARALMDTATPYGALAGGDLTKGQLLAAMHEKGYANRDIVDQIETPRVFADTMREQIRELYNFSAAA